MSKFAFGFLMLALSSQALDIFMPSGDLGDLPLIAAGTFFIAWLIALLVGRRIKFDPLLR